MKVTSLALAIAGTSTVAAFSPSIIESRTDRLVSKSASRFPKRQDSSDNFNITLFHINDVHAHLDDYRTSGADCTDPTKGCVGGYARVKTKLAELRPARTNSLFLNLGDEFQGTLFFNYYGAEKISETINGLGFDAFVPGNHEFDRGDDYLAEFFANLTFPIVCGNIESDNAALTAPMVPYHIFEEHALAVIGVTTPDTKGISKPGAGTTFLDPIEVAQASVDEVLSTTNVTRIVAMTHIGYEKDQELAASTRGIDIIIGGHSHTLLGDMEKAEGKYPTIVQNLDGEDVFIVTSYRWGEYLGYMDLTFDKEGKIVSYQGAPIHLDNTTAQEPELQAEVDEWRVPFDEYGKQVVASTVQVLDQTACQLSECTLGDLISDATLAYHHNVTAGADAALFNAGGIRASIDAGDITISQVLTSFPFGNLVCDVKFTGADLWKIFEGIVSKVNQWNNKEVTSFVQVSKEIKFSYNPANAVGSRLIGLSINGEPLSPAVTKEYTIVTWDFVATGGDNFFLPQTGFPTLDSQDVAFLQYLEAVKTVDVSLDGRISTTDATTPPA